MESKKGFIKVRVWLIINYGDKISINQDATFNPSDEFSNLINDKEEKFRSAIVTFINDAIGLHNWAVRFEQLATDDSMYKVKIWAESESGDDIKIKDIIEERIPHKELEYKYEGTINDYLNNS